MLMGTFREIRNFDPLTGLVTVEPGCLIRDLEKKLNSFDRQLRLLPSTWRSASIGQIHQQVYGSEVRHTRRWQMEVHIRDDGF